MDWTQHIRLRHLQLLASLAETQNISHSARQLHMTQPALSRWLKDFEEDIGLPLFERRARGLRPTAYCEALLEHTRRIGIALDRARTEMAALREGSTGYVAIGSSGATIASSVSHAVCALLQRMPAVRIDIVDAEMERLISMLMRRELDIAIGRPCAEYINPQIKSQELLVEPIHFVARAGHPLHARGTLGWEDLYRYRWVVPNTGASVRMVLEDGLRDAGRDMPVDVLQSNSVFVSLSLLLSTDLLSVASQGTIEQYEKLGGLKRLPIPLHAFCSVNMYWRRDALHSKAVDAALRCLRALYQ